MAGEPGRYIRVPEPQKQDLAVSVLTAKLTHVPSCVRNPFGNGPFRFQAVRSVAGPGLVSCDSCGETRHNSVAGELAQARYNGCSGNPFADPSLDDSRDHPIHTVPDPGSYPVL